jgi:hypothetical protein
MRKNMRLKFWQRALINKTQKTGKLDEIRESNLGESSTIRDRVVEKDQAMRSNLLKSV